LQSTALPLGHTAAYDILPNLIKIVN